MKNAVKLFGITAFVIGFSMVACSGISGQSFKSRLAEGRADSDINYYSNGPSSYAASTQSLQTFKARLAEGRADSDINYYSSGPSDYAKSKHSL